MRPPSLKLPDGDREHRWLEMLEVCVPFQAVCGHTGQSREGSQSQSIQQLFQWFQFVLHTHHVTDWCVIWFVLFMN